MIRPSAVYPSTALGLALLSFVNGFLNNNSITLFRSLTKKLFLFLGSLILTGPVFFQELEYE